ncbi:tRNA (guanosine(46)-N7)-methyltransferase TrmB [Halarcobacter bivalviorum]|uniref:tRNA (guanine-N(7)-)-methyltransferase n=1 Tax=Halarcobacter bivalviorum TaxID=663364 RepID=A0AAX2AAX5_9BACT|nr:tRNA (guanosine(46)-N7)-methyltransferase TrmB [Halarcobacter bivalviorum]AXH11929.1 tRNA m7G46 methyltransferase [Halarcobacter bivalviorum]RXK11049.1 tRNA (guanosine(46)-N7)-methyltransferase TrmB [Halarcobacter bivalviorum]
MPHIVFNKINKELNVPSSLDGTNFNFIAKSYNFTDSPRKTEYKISTTRDKKEFLLTLREKEEKLLLKPDKVTRISPVQLIKDSLNSYAKITEAEIAFSNTQNFSQKVEPTQEYLKDIDYFVNDFNTDKEIQIEIGFGSGRHLLHQAKTNPDVQFIGLEIHTPSIEQLLKQIKIQEIKNILVVNYDARLFMEFIKSNKVGRIFVHFPVPWDKKPHRRIYSNDFINEALRVLKITGTLELRTDSRKYFDYCVELLTNLPKGKITIDINKDLAVSSKYEDRWKRQGKHIYDVVLTCEENDAEINHEFDFSFKKEINFLEVIKRIPTKTLVEKDYFVHVEDIFTIENKENSGLIQITFGNFDRPLSKYILVEEGKASYFQDSPLPTSANIKAHQKIKEILE